jgi:transposase
MEISARKASQQLRISYPTVHKAFHVIRQSIIAHSENSDSLLDGEGSSRKTCLGNRRKRRGAESFQSEFPVFGITERNGWITVEPLQGLSAETVLNQTEGAVRTGSIVYSDRWGRYDALMSYSYKNVTEQEGRYSREDVSVNRADVFLRYAKERMVKFHGVSKKKVALYLKEMEFRYNHRQASIFNTLVQYLCDLRPT